MFLRGEFLIDSVYLSAFPLETRHNDCMLATCSTTNDEMLPETNPNASANPETFDRSTHILMSPN